MRMLKPDQPRLKPAAGRLHFYWFSSPQTFYPLAGRMIPVFGVLAGLLGIAGMYVGFFIAPTDAQQGDAYRIIFIHVPAAWMSMFLYVVMAMWSGVGLVLNTRLSAMMATSIDSMRQRAFPAPAVPRATG